MNRFSVFLIFIVCSMLNSTLYASTVDSLRTISIDTVFISKYIDSLHITKKRIYDSNNVGNNVLNPYIYRILGPSTYYRNSVGNSLTIDWMPETEIPYYKNTATEEIDYREKLNAAVNRHLVNTYLNNPRVVAYYDSQFLDEELIDQGKHNAKEEDLKEVLNNVAQVDDVSDVISDLDVDIKITRPNFWTKSGKGSMKFQQNYFSENWHQGGNNTLTMRAELMLYANYNDQQKIKWDNSLEMCLGFTTTTSDSCHTYITNSDWIRFKSKLNMKAIKKWDYTVSLEANTQFMPGYRTNDKRTYSNFLAPLDVFLSVGMDFRPSLKSGQSMSLEINPLSYKLRYIGSDEETIHRQYGMLGKDTEESFGTKINYNSTFKLVKNLIWKCRFYYYTSYEYVEGELENRLSYELSKYISTELFTIWRYDDRRYYDDNLGHFQFKEYLSLGLNYSF